MCHHILVKKTLPPASPACFLLALLVGCGEPQVPCTPPCPDIAGEYVLETASSMGMCDFQPVILVGGLIIEQSEDTTTASTTIRDSLTNEDLRFSGEIYRPQDRDPAGTVAGFSMSEQVIRPATVGGADLLTLQVTLSGTVMEQAGRREISGSLLSIDVTPTTGTGCDAGISFIAVQEMGEMGD